jgi:chromate transporter
MKLIHLFLIFIKFGAFTFGGGYAMIGFMDAYFVQNKKLIQEDVMSDYIAVAQMVPGMIALNLAHLVGRHLKGFLGGLVSVIGVSLPSIVIISLLAYGLNPILELDIVQDALRGILGAVVIILAQAIYKMAKGIKTYPMLYLYTMIVFVLVTFFQMSFVYIIFMSILLSVIHHAYMVKRVSKHA